MFPDFSLGIKLLFRSFVRSFGSRVTRQWNENMRGNFGRIWDLVNYLVRSFDGNGNRNRNVPLL